MSILYHFKSLLFYFYSYGVESSIDILDPENQPGFRLVKIPTGSGALELTEDV